jgi:outer membrane receptor for ferric coprogen and ferric-rhodotorulic acid
MRYRTVRHGTRLLSARPLFRLMGLNIGLTVGLSSVSCAVFAQASTADATANAALPMVSVSASTAADAVAARVNPTTTVGSKIPLSQREISQSLSVVTQEQIQSENLADLKQALRQTTGVSITSVDQTRMTVYARGFPIDTMDIDGVSTPITYLTPPSLAMYDRVEVLRGPAGLYSGSGGPGGTINLVRKRAPSTFTFNAETGAGNYNQFHEQVDVGGPLNKSGSLRGRVVGVVDNANLEQDGTHRSNTEIYGTLEYDVNAHNTVRVGASHQAFAGKSMQYGYPTYANGTFLNVSPSTYYGADWNREDYTLTTAFAELQSRLSHGWTSTFSVNYRDMNRNSKFAGLRGAVALGGSATAYQTSQTISEDVQKIVDFSASGPFHLLGRQHQLTVGVNILDENAPQVSAPGAPRTIAVNLNSPVDPAVVNLNNNKSAQTTYTNEYALYSNARFNLADPLTLVVGGRLSWWRSRVDPSPYLNANAIAQTSGSENAHFTPYAGLIYDINDTYSAYVSYAQVFKPQSERDASGTLLKPLVGEQYEAGIKGSYLNDRINTSLAIFQLTEKNRGIAVGDTADDIYVAQGKARSRGVEAQVSGQVLPGLDVSLGYTYTWSKYLDASADTGRAAFSAYTPKNLFKAWANYRMPGKFHAITVGGGLYVSSAYSSSSTTATVRQHGFATVDLRAGYDIDKHTSISVNVNNVFNRRYYQSIQTTSDHNYLGDPLMVMATLRYHY